MTEPQKTKLELVLSERKLKLKQGYVNNSKNEEQRYRKILKEWFADEKRFIDEVTLIVKDLPPQPIAKETPELNKALISFNNLKIIDDLHNELKGFFQGNEVQLKKALEGEELTKPLLFPHNQNKFVEVFKRLKYNNFLVNTPKEIKEWICVNFRYQYQRGGKKEVRKFNESTVHDILTKDKGEPTKNERICTVDWLPYKGYVTRKQRS